ncbi:MAG: EF-P 5-aminopentanol modification-associated protein YfmF [Huintestinicola sp.]
MSIRRIRTDLGCGVFLTELIDPKLKTNSFVVHFITDHSRETASANAILPIILTDSTAEYPTITALSRRLSELYGASLRGGVSRFGDSSTITISAVSIADKYALEGEKLSIEIIKLLNGAIFAPHMSGDTFCTDDFHLKKQELLDDIDADINDKRFYAVKQASSIIYDNEPAGIPLKGDRSTAETLTPETAYAAYKTLLRSAHIEISYVGSGLDDDARNELIAPFKAMKRSDVNSINLSPSPAKAQPVNKTERLDVVQSKMVIGYKSSSSDIPAMKLFNAIFGGTPFSLLFDNVRERLSLCYYCSSSYNPKKRTLVIDSGVENANISSAEAEIQNQLEEIRKGNFSDELMNQTKLAMINTLKSVNDTPKAVVEWYFGQCHKPEEKILTPQQHIDEINSVTRERVIECADSLTLDTVYVLTGKEDC